MKRRRSLVSIHSAAKILEPAYGGFANAKEIVTRAIRSSRLELSATEPSPEHPNPSFSNTSDIGPSMIVGHDGSTPPPAVLEDVRDSELAKQWRRYLYEGGIALKRKEVCKYLVPQTDQRVNPDLIHKIKNDDTHWNLVQLLTWVSTRSYTEVAQISCDNNWEPLPKPKPAQLGMVWANTPSPRTFERMKKRQILAQERALGWLRHKTAEKFCKCGSKKHLNFEAWEKCMCVSKSLSGIKMYIEQQKLTALAAEGLSPLDPEIANSFRLEGFNLSAAGGAGQVLFNRFQCVELFSPRGSGGGRKPRYDWDEFERVAKKKIEYHEGFPNDWLHADCVREMAEWCSQHWGEEPALSSIKAKVTAVEKGFKADQKEN